MISLAITVHSDRCMPTDTHTNMQLTYCINTYSICSGRIEAQRPGLSAKGLLVSCVQFTLWANGQTERVKNIRSESICCLRYLLIGMYTATELRARGEQALCLDWNIVFHKENTVLLLHFWIEFLPASLYLLNYRIIYLCSSVLNTWHWC